MEKSIKVARNHFELSTYQRRLRHLRCLALRNLYWPGHKGKDLTNLQSFFTLHTDRNSPAFYTSEKIQGSLNPTWQSFDISRYEDKINTRLRFLVLKVWVGIKDKFELLIDWDVNIMGLVFFADKLQQDTVKYAANSLIFGMFDKYFVAPETNLSQKADIIGTVMNVDSAVVRNSYRTSSVFRIYTVLRATKQTQATVNKYHRCIEDKLLSSQEKSLKLSSREALIMKRAQMRSELEWQMSRLQSAKDDLDKLKNCTQQKEEEINERFLKLKKDKEDLQESKKSYNQTRENFIKEEAQWKIRRKQLIGELATHIYPITENKQKECFICHVKLPDSESFQGIDDTQIGAALGYTAHLVSMMSHILDVPLRYPIEHRSSRSQITDHIHHKLTEKDNTFPLYSKGKEKFYFNYGVYLLNKDIGQLRFFCGLGTADLRTTLQNIKSLLELRLGTKVENQNRLQKPGSDVKDKSFNDFDTHSSLASGGRYSAPDSSEVTPFENVLTGTKLNNIRRENDSFSNLSSANSTTYRQQNDDPYSEDITFHPSPEDNFFKISNPVSDKVDIFNDINAIESDIKVTEMIDFSDTGLNQASHDRTDSFDYKGRTDSDLTNNSSDQLDGKNVILESQISILSKTEYHSDFKRFLSIGIDNIHSEENSIQDDVTNVTINNSPDSRANISEHGNRISKEEPSHNSNILCDNVINSSNASDQDSVNPKLCNNSDLLQADAFENRKESSEISSDISKGSEEEFPEFQRTFKTLSFRQNVNKSEEDYSSDNVVDDM